MHSLSYYKTISVSIPKKDDYMTIYYYRNGIMVGLKKQFDDNFHPPKDCVEEKLFDDISYQAHLKHYYSEVDRLNGEFKNDLFKKYNIKDSQKSNKLFEKAWDFGSSSGLWDVEDYFVSLLDLLSDDTQHNKLVA